MAGLATYLAPTLKGNKYNLPDLPSLLDTDPNKLQEILNRMQLQASMGKITQGGTDTVYGGGRAGYSLPVGDNALTAGLTAGGYSNKYGDDFGLTGADVAYNFGKNAIGANYEKNRYVQELNPRGGIDTGKLLELFYRRQF
jgi:hypothetical protein